MEELSAKNSYTFSRLVGYHIISYHHAEEASLPIQGDGYQMQYRGRTQQNVARDMEEAKAPTEYPLSQQRTDQWERHYQHRHLRQPTNNINIHLFPIIHNEL